MYLSVLKNNSILLESSLTFFTMESSISRRLIFWARETYELIKGDEFLMGFEDSI